MRKNKEKKEMIEALEESFENIKGKMEKNPEGILIAMYIPNVSDRDYKKFDTGEKGVEGCRMVKADCNDNTMEVAINALEELVHVFKSKQSIKKFLKKMLTLNIEDDDEDDDEDEYEEDED